APMLAVFLLVGCVFYATVRVKGSPSQENSSATSATSLTTTKSKAPPSPRSTFPPAIPGFQGVAVSTRGIAYDVPAQWEVDSPGTIRGFENSAGDRIGGTGTATEGEDYCPETSRALSFVSRPDPTDAATAAAEVGRLAAKVGFEDLSGGETTMPVEFGTATGILGQLAETSGLRHTPGCTGDRYSVYTFVFPGPQHPLLALTVSAARNTPGEITPEVVRQILSSVRYI
ncbi:hypothetical protein, partial [Streptomyces roseolus]|uniref:hypothetical protein n=1 Tax=Streptomyces roseolus TaxID=67358 RepID=UPI00365ADD0B